MTKFIKKHAGKLALGFFITAAILTVVLCTFPVSGLLLVSLISGAILAGLACIAFGIFGIRQHNQRTAHVATSEPEGEYMQFESNDNGLAPALGILIALGGLCAVGWYSFFAEDTPARRPGEARDNVLALRELNALYDTIRDEQQTINIRLTEIEQEAVARETAALARGASLHIGPIAATPGFFGRAKVSRIDDPEQLHRVELLRNLNALMGTYPALDKSQCDDVSYLARFQGQLKEHHAQVVAIATEYFAARRMDDLKLRSEDELRVRASM